MTGEIPDHITVINNPGIGRELEQLRLDVRADIKALYWCIYILFAAVVVLGAGLARVVF